jgi:DnaJ-class molecular chaperone
MLQRSYYLVLGVSRSESDSGIRRAFRELVQRYHPDRVGPSYLNLFQEIVDAYRVLSDPERRRWYDRGLAHAQGRPSMVYTPIFTNGGTETNPSLVPAIADFLPVQMDRILFEVALARLAKLLGATSARTQERAEGLDVQIVLSPEQAVKGGAVTIALPSYAPCSSCGSSGRHGLFSCAACDGEGLSAEKDTVRVTIPPMAGDDTIVEVPLRGLGVHNIYLRVHIRVAD